MKHLFAWILFATLQIGQSQNILQYHPVLLLLEPKSGAHPPELAIRSYFQNMNQMYLIVNPDDLTTHAEASNQYQNKPTSWEELRRLWASKPFLKALDQARQKDIPLQDAGITHLNDPKPGISLTADLCPSRLPLDRRVFTALIQTAADVECPIPIALSVSGMWMQTHPSDLSWLKELVTSGYLRITWINHTLHHHWDNNLPLSENFLLERGTNLITEVMGNEEWMLENGILPSCFFRFPGLVSDKSISDQIIQWGLIPIGSDAWLAKGQNPKASGSIVLIHANGNEPLGVQEFLRLLKEEKAAIQHGEWRLLDLREELKER